MPKTSWGWGLLKNGGSVDELGTFFKVLLSSPLDGELSYTFKVLISSPLDGELSYTFKVLLNSLVKKSVAKFSAGRRT